MVTYRIVYSKRALKAIPFLKAAHLDGKARTPIDIIRTDPYATPPGYEILKGNLSGTLSRRINIQHRLVYEVCEEERTIKILSMWAHYDI